MPPATIVLGLAVSEAVIFGADVTSTEQVAVWVPEVTVTVRIPVVDHWVEKLAAEPVAGVPPPDQENVPVPPEAVMVALVFTFTL